MLMPHRRAAPGSAPGTLLSRPSAAGGPVITLIEYDARSITEKRIARAEELSPCLENGKVDWINVDGLGDVETLRAIGNVFGLHPLALEDVLNLNQRPKVEEYEGHFFIVTRMIFHEGERGISSEQVSIFLGKCFLITFQEEATRDVFEPVRHRLRSGGGFARNRGHDYLVYALLDAVTDHYFPVLEKLGDTLEHLETDVLERPTQRCVVVLHELKRALLELRRSAWPEREVRSVLSRDESGLILPDTRIFLRDCYDHTVQIMDVIESYRDLTSGIMDLYLSSVSMRTNEIIRVLTVVTAVFIPLTFIAGIYGMNFDTEISPYNMPELEHPYGYVICIGVMAMIGLGMLILFWKKRWL